MQIYSWNCEIYLFIAFSFFNPASPALAQHACISKHLPASFLLLFSLSLSRSVSSYQQQPAPPTISPSSVHKAWTSPPLRAPLPSGQVLLCAPADVSHLLTSNYLLNISALMLITSSRRHSFHWQHCNVCKNYVLLIKWKKKNVFFTFYYHAYLSFCTISFI